MRGSCVAWTECQFDAEPRLLAVDTALTVDAGGVVAMWASKEKKAFAGVEIKAAGKDATVRTYGSNSPEGWKKHGKIPTSPGPLTLTAQKDGTALLSNGKTTWVLAQDDRYGAVKFTKRK
jgi:hypothetical protein